MNILITGGAGFIGCHLVKYLAGKGHRIWAVSRSDRIPEELFGQSGITFLKTNRFDYSDVERFFRHIDIVIHLAWSSIPTMDIDDFSSEVKYNVSGTIQLLNVCSKYKVKQFIFLSSGGTVYGVPQQIPIPETHPLNPISSYGIGKLCAEKYITLYSNLFEMKTTILRVANAFGERQNLLKGQGVVGIWLSKILDNEPIEIWGNDKKIRDFIYVGDLVRVIEKVLTMDTKSQIYNIGSGKGHALKDLLEIFRNELDLDFSVRLLPERLIDVPVNVLSINKAASELDFDPVMSLEEGIKRTLGWLKSSRMLVKV